MVSTVSKLLVALLAFQSQQCVAFIGIQKGIVLHHRSASSPIRGPTGHCKGLQTNPDFVFTNNRGTASVTRSLSVTDANSLAVNLGYLVAAGSLLLYTPIAVRVARQGSANGLTISTWWLKLSSYTCSDVYAFSKGYPLSTYAETLVITAESAVILLLVASVQKRFDAQFAALASVYALILCWAIFGPAPPEVVALGQASSAVLNTGAIIPQLMLNAERRSPGDYSPVTAGLAALGCAIRLFTTVQLADSDPVLLGTFGVALLVNGTLLTQILYYGMAVRGQSLGSLLLADVRSKS
uniref:Mannose-P-dolichol utilization defect 1 protein homolog n=1 Tax=Trieres chinensis TaxID=1514140 RepID=A0A7S2EU39_TRICV|mmetsp:Transcript_39055/g.79630  ORF Transcript_39055/g.79630 Transcript_39055/m.79630 type:complete len:296 (+) Transcript_39055:228-1115(+)|eukprot:CAMPEP_0183292322 /NCGR_PEP_ID=MMETSP0160_2-20130417/1417_1 /TAXON_ID=2839 ORGANISM="Odontella Sinensis, Strain Grunow 1884" /NCGR_SAMPLE_ID=MMETSP0160_2 /ASSEMBLY_ACC=CAM_ASM_000250 /LENGTH=295 /DNA_ID=CAMNT_0025453253 /DNA_START=213 /DNA_END=1100 /DNA_ORIENTATION=+